MATLTAPVGLVYPPRDIRVVIDKTAQFVANVGPEFEGRVRADQNSKKFEFLTIGHPYRPYYEFKVTECQKGQSKETAPDKPLALQKAEAELAAKKDKKVLKALTNKAEEEQEITPPPPDVFTYAAGIPGLTPLDADIIQWTAQYVARNGQKFLIGLTQRESKNPQYDFLKPTHSLFPYFTSLVDAYTRVLMPSKDDLAELRKYANADGFQFILQKCRRRYLYEERQEKIKKAENEKIALEKEQMATIDWHDFIIVETIDFTKEDEDMPLAEPIDTTKKAPEPVPDALDKETQAAMPGGIIEEDEPMELEEGSEHGDEEAAKSGSDMDVDSDKEDIDSEEEEREQQKAKDADEAKKKKEEADAIPLPDLESEGIKIKTNYVRSKKKEPELHQMQKCPLTGQYLPVDDMNEHLRITMLNPQWKKDQDAQMSKKKQENLFAEDVEANLAAFVAKRPDIFGTVDEEIQVAAEAGAEQSAREAGADAGPAAAVYNPEAVKPLPPAPPTMGIAGMPGGLLTSAQFGAVPGQQIFGRQQQGQIPLPPPGLTPVPVMSMPIPSPYGTMPGFTSMGVNLGGMDDDEGIEESDAKRLKIETSLLPEFQWAQSHPRPINITVKVNPDFGIREKQLTLTVEVTKTVNTFKSMLETLTGVGATKMQIRDERTTLVMRQTRSLAWYNVADNSTLHMMPKERGGKKK